MIATAALALAGCGGSSDSAANANPRATTTTATAGRQGGAARRGTAGGTATSGTLNPRAAPASNPQGTTTSTRAATSTQAATTTTRLDTIKPLPGRPPAPVFDYNHSHISPASPVTVNGTSYGVCRGTPPTTEVILSWQTYYTDFVEIDRGSTNYPAYETDLFLRVQCDANHGVGSDPRAGVTFTLFGPGGEATASARIFVDRNYQT